MTTAKNAGRTAGALIIAQGIGGSRDDVRPAAAGPGSAGLPRERGTARATRRRIRPARHGDGRVGSRHRDYSAARVQKVQRDDGTVVPRTGDCRTVTGRRRERHGDVAAVVEQGLRCERRRSRFVRGAAWCCGRVTQLGALHAHRRRWLDVLRVLPHAVSIRADPARARGTRTGRSRAANRNCFHALLRRSASHFYCSRPRASPTWRRRCGCLRRACRTGRRNRSRSQAYYSSYERWSHA